MFLSIFQIHVKAMFCAAAAGGGGGGGGGNQPLQQNKKTRRVKSQVRKQFYSKEDRRSITERNQLYRVPGWRGLRDQEEP